MWLAYKFIFITTAAGLHGPCSAFVSNEIITNRSAALRIYWRFFRRSSGIRSAFKHHYDTAACLRTKFVSSLFDGDDCYKQYSTLKRLLSDCVHYCKRRVYIDFSTRHVVITKWVCTECCQGNNPNIFLTVKQFKKKINIEIT